jgi:hypothetical protein
MRKNVVPANPANPKKPPKPLKPRMPRAKPQSRKVFLKEAVLNKNPPLPLRLRDFARALFNPITLSVFLPDLRASAFCFRFQPQKGTRKRKKKGRPGRRRY